MKECCEKHNKMGDPMGDSRGKCGWAGRGNMFDSYCCKDCPSLKAYRKAKKKTLESFNQP